MKDLTIALENRPGALAEMGEALGRAGVSVEGGGAFVVDGAGVAHFLFADGAAARRALEAAGIRVLEERDVLVQRLNQDEPGQLGKISRRMAEAGVNIEVLYSDHDHNLILVVDDPSAGRRSQRRGCASAIVRALGGARRGRKADDDLTPRRRRSTSRRSRQGGSQSRGRGGRPDTAWTASTAAALSMTVCNTSNTK